MKSNVFSVISLRMFFFLRLNDLQLGNCVQ